MKKIMTGALALMVATAAHAADEVKLQLQWVTQAQFAGYYVALDKGYYSAEELDVTILSGGPDIAPPQVLAGGGADVMLNWMPSALAAREGRLTASAPSFLGLVGTSRHRWLGSCCRESPRACRPRYRSL